MADEGRAESLESSGPSMSFHLEVLASPQKLILKPLGLFAESNSFYLGGGTAIALYLGRWQGSPTRKRVNTNGVLLKSFKPLTSF